MIFFRVTDNINIKTTDGTLVKYFKLKNPSNLVNETLYLSTFEDFKDLKTVFANVDKERYKVKFIKELAVRKLETFPIELGISNENEYLKYQDYLEDTKGKFYNDDKNLTSFLHSNEKVDIYKQLKIKNKNITLAVIGTIGKSISEMIASCTALRILHMKLKEIYDEVKIDLYISASNNSFFSRDKQIYAQQEFIRRILPLSLNTKELCSYDYFIDNSCVLSNSSFYSELNAVDACLYKFGIDYEKIPASLKYNQLNIQYYKPKNSLIETIKKAKQKGKLLLYHPFSANVEKSIPQTYAVKYLKELILKFSDEYTIISALNIDGKIKDDAYIDLSKESKLISDFVYIISLMDRVITVNTSTYHISDAFMIPTVVLFTNDDSNKKTKYYTSVKSVKIKDKSKSLSKFVFNNDALTFYKFESWEKFKIKKLKKLLDNF